LSAERVAMSDRVVHRTSVEIFPPLPEAVAAGSTVARRARVTCSFGCNLRGAAIRVVDADDEDILTTVLTTFRDKKSETGEFSLVAPHEHGEWTWSVVFDGQEGREADHGASFVTASTHTGAGVASLAVWGIESPVTSGSRFRMKVGAMTSAGHSLAGSRVAVHDAAGEVAGEGMLGDTPWPGAGDLYWTELEAVAPDREGRLTWTVRLVPAEPHQPGGEASSSFGFTVVPPPEARLTVSVIDKASRTPIDGAEVRLRARGDRKDGEGEGAANGAATTFVLRGVTDNSGIASLMAPKGDFDLVVWKARYSIPTLQVSLTGDAAVSVEAAFVPKKKNEQVWM
jgi:hypothetical protein